MKILKIVLGFGILIGMGAEYANAAKQIGSMFLPTILIVVLLLMVLTTWLFGSGFSAGKFNLKSVEFFKFFSLSAVIFAGAVILNLGSKLPPSDFVKIQGLNIPLGKCINGNRKVIPDEKERKEYCKCFIEKILLDPELKEKFQDKLIHDESSTVFKEIQTHPKFLELNIDACIGSSKIEWTDDIVNSMRKQMKKMLLGTTIEETIDINSYCDCLLMEYQKHPFNKVVTEEFLESEVAIDIENKCIKTSGNQDVK